MSIATAYQTSSSKSVIIQTDLPNQAVSGLAEFFERYYIVPNQRFIDRDSYRKIESGGAYTFSWRLRVHEMGHGAVLSSALKISQPAVELSFQDLDRRDRSQVALCARTIDDVETIVWSYLQHAKVTSLYFVIRANDEEHSESPSKEGNTQRSILRRIFSGNSANAFLSFMFVSFVLFFVIGFYTVFVLIGLQSVYLLYSDRIMLNMGNVRPTSENPLVTIVSVRSTPEILNFLRRHGKKILAEMREEVSLMVAAPSVDAFRGSFVKKASDMKSSILAILERHGIVASANDIEIKTRDVYAIVGRVAEKFNRPVPKIVIVNTVVSNAAATGISANRSSIMINAGSLEDLTDEELESVLGHELGHVKGHDPVILFAANSFEFIGMFYLWLPILLYLGFLYFVLAFGSIFALGKVLETRADTECAVVIGNPGAIASSLRKIGFRQLYREKYAPLVKLLDWFRFDPHPPIYFRVARMSKFAASGRRTKHTFLVSLGDCIVGFLSAFV
jgi:heat shock protein HtpX